MLVQLLGVTDALIREAIASDGRYLLRPFHYGETDRHHARHLAALGRERRRAWALPRLTVQVTLSSRAVPACPAPCAC